MGCIALGGTLARDRASSRSKRALNVQSRILLESIARQSPSAARLESVLNLWRGCVFPRMSLDRAAYPSDVSDEEWALVAPYLARLRESSGQRDHELREVFNGLRYIVRTGAAWRLMPHDLPPWAAVYQQTQRWLSAECFADVAGDLRAVLRMAAAREPAPSAVILDSRTLRSTPESGERAGYDGAKRQKGSKVHLAVDTPGPVVALHVTPADVGERGEGG